MDKLEANGEGDRPALSVRLARPADVPTLNALIERSVRGLQHNDYTGPQLDSLLKYVFGVDTQLIEDGTYYVIEAGIEIVGSGGWSRRKTLFGGDQAKNATEDSPLDPAHDPAKIRAFFVHPGWARRGIGRLLMQTCQEAAREAGFRRLELMATLTGVGLYTVSGFKPLERVEVRLADGVVVHFVRMAKELE